MTLLLITVVTLTYIVAMQAIRIHHLQRRVDRERVRAETAETLNVDRLMGRLSPFTVDEQAWEHELAGRDDGGER